ncbi:MAG TPA: nitrile hydratase subunit beta [Planctomycetota bacterium]|nr:nitrile hydratase subunit beta [Planctomycetota bacterium]
MNGIHDLGGMQGFGSVIPEPDEPVFHSEWERRVFALTVACGFLGRWNLDRSRSAREQMPPAEYLATSYYEHWLFGLERLLDETGLVAPRETEARLLDPRSPWAPPPEGPARTLRAADVLAALRDPRGARSDAEVSAGFKVHDRVRARDLNPVGHTRLPRYCRGRQGIIHADQGVWIFPDTHASGRGPSPQHVYSVRFAATDLWGPSASPRDFVHVDLWEDYLEPA